MSIVSLSIKDQNAAATYHKGLEEVLAPFGGGRFFARPGETLLLYLGQIWPARPELGVNPHPALLQALYQMGLNAGAARVQVAALAAPGFDFAQTWHMAGYALLGLPDAAVCDLAVAEYAERESALNLATPRLAVALPLLRADCLINLVKYRAEQQLLFGSAINNLAAAARLDAQAPHYQRLLVDLYSLLHPDVHVADACRGSQGFQPLQQDALLAAQDALALDITLAAFSGIAPRDIEHMWLAAQYGLGSAHAGDIHVVGGDALALFAAEAAQE